LGWKSVAKWLLEHKGKRKVMIEWKRTIAEDFYYKRRVKLVQDGEECGATVMVIL
jgi:hypothetical protein